MYHVINRGNAQNKLFRSCLGGAEDEHYLTVLRSVEHYALQADSVPQAEDWSWSSLRMSLES